MEIKEISLKEKAERAMATATLIWQLETHPKELLEDSEIQLIRKLNIQMDELMKDESVKRLVLNELKKYGNPVIWTPGG